MQTNEFQESSIRQSLEGTKYKAKLDELNETVKPVLDRTVNTLIGFTDHSLNHSLGVENAYDILLDGKYDTLNDQEKYFLIAATLLHDIGMVGLKTDLKMQDYEGFRRKAHNYISKDRIIEQAIYLGLDHDEAVIIAQIAEAHRKVDLDTLDEEKPFGMGKTVLRVRLLGAMLRFADELHVTKGRTNTLVMNILELDEESMKHHKRHERVSGVGRIPSQPGTIIISASAEDWEMESLMLEMVDEIKNKYEQVKEILEKNEISVADVKLQLHVEEIVQKEICLELAEEPQSLMELMDKLNHRKPQVISKMLEALKFHEILRLDDSTNKYNLVEDETTCKKVFNYLKTSDQVYKFIQSAYLKQNIGHIFDEIAYRIYGHRIENGDREDRLLLTRNSPIVLDHLLNKQDMDPHFAQLNRSVVLDLLILNGYMQDVSKFPSLSKDEEIILAMQNIQNSLHTGLNPFLKLVQHLDPDIQEQSKKRLEESFEKKN
ncbi:hypothetical protein Q8G31_27055 [Priestia megaterium]|uniref:HD domain-containing protein n=1 Tax=Priestia megaterium TaxID=1404 RepID=UPI00272F0E37|nr:hypothetical protein [Priestia megaterium]MDP1383378.1 hypothetical protein [Priestia megaterium]MDP1427526.1 hypothetical protein [Priestia megaterium]